MSDFPHDGFSLPDLWRALEDLEDGTLDPSRREEVTALLKRSPAARRAYLEFFEQSAIFQMEAARVYERDLLPDVDSASRRQLRLQRSMVAVAALVALMAMIGALISVTRAKPASLSASVAPETQWSIDGVAQRPGSDPVAVSEGSTVRVVSGMVKLGLESGNQFVLQGPAIAAFPALHRPQLREGWLWIDASETDEPFQVEAAGLWVRNIGTRFAVRAPAEGPAEVHLIKGRVQVLAAHSGSVLGGLDTDGKAFAFTTEVKSEELPLAADPFPGLPELLGQPTNYRSAVIGQSPVGYWTFDIASEEPAPDEVRESSTGYDENVARKGEPGIGPDSGFHGFPETNQSIYLTGHIDQSVVGDLGGPHGVSRREGAVSFWFRRSTDAALRDEVLWLAGTGDGSLSVPSRAIMHTRISASGRIVFEVENGDDRIHLSSSQDLVDGRWHHVVASWGTGSVDLYVDGQRVGSDHELRTMPEGMLRGRYVRFGKPSLDMPENFGAFTGWLDELALWDRPLSPTEVGIQYRVAVGAAGDSGD